MTKETSRVIETITGRARATYEKKRVIAALRELEKEMDDPGYIQKKDFALTVCNMLICLNVEHGNVKKGSPAHKLGLRLYDYISRMEEAG